MNPCSRRKQYVEVLATHFIDGSIQPRTIVTADGASYEIDQVRSVGRGKSPRTGEIATRYRIRIGSHETYLYEDNGRWYVEYKEARQK